MKTIKFNGKDYHIPQAWGEVTLAQIIKASELSELLSDAPVVAIISAYTGIPIKDLKVNTALEVTTILEDMAFISEMYKPTPISTFTLDNIVYKAEEDLVNQRFEDWVAIQTTLLNYENDRVRALPYMLAILCKREKETLDDFILEDRAKLMLTLPMTVAKDVEAFFLHMLSAYKAISLLSSTADAQKELVLHKAKELSNIMKTRKAQYGIFSGTRFRIGIYQLQLWWVRKVLVKYFNSQVTNNSKKTWIQTCKNWLMRKLKGKRNGNNNN